MPPEEIAASLARHPWKHRGVESLRHSLTVSLVEVLVTAVHGLPTRELRGSTATGLYCRDVGNEQVSGSQEPFFRRGGQAIEVPNDLHCRVENPGPGRVEKVLFVYQGFGWDVGTVVDGAAAERPGQFHGDLAGWITLAVD